MMTNLGLLRYDRQRPHQLIPKIMRLHKLELTEVKGQYKGKRHIFKLKYLNDKEKESEKYFSVDTPESYPVWLSKIRNTIAEYRQLGARILIPPSERQQALEAQMDH